jgi:hypothetical protein
MNLMNNVLSVQKRSFYNDDDALFTEYNQPNINNIPRTPEIETNIFNKDTIIIQTTSYLLSIAEALKLEFEKKNCNVLIMDAEKIQNDIGNNINYTKKAIFIFLFIWNINEIIPSDITYYIYNLQQIHKYSEFPFIPVNNNKTLIRNLFNNSAGILDYSLTNISMYKSKRHKKKLIYYPIPCPNTYTITSTEKKIDILFFGSLTIRRKKILKYLQNVSPLKILIISGNKQVYGKELHKYINNSKIILNIHAEENSLLEIGRIHDCLACNHCKIISELPTDIDEDIVKDYEKLVYFFPIIKDDFSNMDNITNLIKETFFIKETRNTLLASNNIKKEISDRLNFINTKIVDHAINDIYFFEKKYGIFDVSNMKIMHRYNCFENINLIRNIKLHDFGIDKTKETVLIEFRKFPHIEFLLRNTIYKLSPDWNHTVVCGIENYELVNSICNLICENMLCNINVIKLEISNLTPSEYSELLLTTDFWNNFEGEKLLIYQEDSLLFHGNIDNFFKYDYIGAPWLPRHDGNSLGVGNGGFSLRSKSKMIECIENVKVEDLELGTSSKEYMNNTNSTILPEDIFFSKALIDFKLGNVSSRNVARTFSQETQLGINPLGGHKFWLAENNKINKSYINQYNLISDYYIKANHRSGWKIVMQNCLDNNIVSNKKNKKNIILIDSMEDYFLYNNNHIINGPWIGIIHFTNDLPFHLKEQEIRCVFDAAYKSINTCIGIITLSKYNEQQVKYFFPKKIKTYFIKHPIEKNNKSFNIENFLNKSIIKPPSIIQLGLQYRQVSTIYTINASNYKIWLPGSDKIKAINTARKELYHLNIPETNLNEVEIIHTDSVDEFDNLLLNNIVIIPLWNASANNSVLECMEMNIPAFVTRLPATEEYLGADYPMFYSDIREVEEIINNTSLFQQKYMESYEYLIALDKSDIHYEHFNSELLKIINH